MKRIVFVANNFGVGGAQKVLTDVANLSNNIGYQSELLSLSNIIPTQEYLQNVTYNSLDYSNYPKYYEKIKEKKRVLGLLKRFWKEKKPDAVIVFGLDATILVKMSIPHNVRVLTSERNAPEAYGRIVFWASVIFYRKCNYIVFQMEQARAFYSRYICADKCLIIPNAYRDYGVSPYEGERRKVISCAAARFDYRKGIDVIIRAFNIVHKSHNDYRLIIYGEGELRPAYEELISELGLNSSVEMPGRIDSVQDAIREDMVFVLPSRNEGIPNVLLEAMGIGIACVACNCVPGGVLNVTDNGRRAALVEVDDYYGMAEAIMRIINNCDYRERLQKAAYEVRSVYSEKRINELWSDALQKLFK